MLRAHETPGERLSATCRQAGWPDEFVKKCSP
jgi:hypothetical protein